MNLPARYARLGSDARLWATCVSAVALLTASACTPTNDDSDGGSDDGDGGLITHDDFPEGLTNGPADEDDPCERHSDCGEFLLCNASGFCKSFTAGKMECKAAADCTDDKVCDELSTTCVVGECSHDLDCATGRCSTLPQFGHEAFVCVECQADADCASGECTAEVCEQPPA